MSTRGGTNPPTAKRDDPAATDAARLLCFCFGHSVGDIEFEVVSGAPDRIRTSIIERCRRGENRCEELNPSGACCLGDVAQAYARAKASEHAVTTSHGEDAPAPVSDCCAAPAESRLMSVGQGSARTLGSSRRWTGAALGAAILSSACCWLPLALVSAGVSAGALGVAFEALRPVFITMSVALLAIGFLAVSRREPSCEPGDACATSADRAPIRPAFWLAVVLCIGFGALPSYLGFFAGGVETGAVANLESGASRTFQVDGMTCEACASALGASLRAVQGVEGAGVDHAAGTAVLAVRPGTPDDDILAVIEDAGFRGERRSTAAGPR